MNLNAIKTAVDRSGGATRVANELRCSGITVYEWIKLGRVPNFDKALKLSKMSGISVQDLRPSTLVEAREVAEAV